MKSIISKLTFGVIATMLCAAAVTTVRAQEKPNLVDLDALAARGVILVNEDPLAMELRRNQGGDDDRKRAFDIGMGVAEGNTAQGPGKDRICASLGGGRTSLGCTNAVLFSVERNRNAALAKKGAAIARADPAAAAIRNATRAVFYKLGFDIGLAAAEGHTLPGPGKDKIRDSLDLSLRGGFNAAVSFTIERNRRNEDLGATTGTTAGPGEKSASNEIRCRGYSRTGGSEYVFFNINSRPGTTGETLVAFEMAFTPGTRAAGRRGEGLQPGDCAWADRSIGEQGPYRIRFETVANAQLKHKLSGSTVDRSSTAAENYPDVNTIPVYLKGEDHYWSFSGITNAGSHFVATANGFWKPAIPIRDVVRSPTEPARPKGVLFPPKP